MGRNIVLDKARIQASYFFQILSQIVEMFAILNNFLHRIMFHHCSSRGSDHLVDIIPEFFVGKLVIGFMRETPEFVR